MFRLFFAIAILSLLGKCHNSEQNYPKCCDSASVFKTTNSTYHCVPDEDLRTQVITNNTNVLAGNSSEAYCIEIEGDDVNVFEVIDGQVIKDHLADVDFFPKCCPINFYYNSTIHACVEASDGFNVDNEFFDEEFVKVGLPQCRIIYDLKLVSHKNFVRSPDSIFLLHNGEKYDRGFYCIDKDEKNTFIVRVCTNDYEICNKVKCVHKCCPDGQSFINGSKCHNTHIRGLDLATLAGSIDNANDSFAIIHGYNPPIYPLVKPRFKFHLASSGVFSMLEFDSFEKLNTTKYYDPQDAVYCIEHAVKKTLNAYSFFRVFPANQNIDTKFYYTRYAMSISCVFLFITIVYYCVSAEKRTVFGKTLISYCTVTLLTFLIYSYLAYDRPGSQICRILGFLVFYTSLSSFTWMNVMCVDIYWTFGSANSFSKHHQRGKELKRFLLYSLYGWGFPMVFTAILLTLYHVNVLPSSLQVIVDPTKCIILRSDGYYAHFLLSTSPSAVLELCNLVLFVKTVVCCLKVKREIAKMNDTHMMKGEKRQKFNKFKDRFGLLIKLFFIMGISFLFEVFSTFCDFKKNKTMAVIETVWDTFNSFQGFFIFLIFICKRRILKKCEKKVGLPKLRKFSLMSSAATQTTMVPHNK